MREPPARTRDPADRVLRACSHPLRTRILAALEQGAASPRELADRLAEPLDAVAYHVRMLAQIGSVELVDTRPGGRGAIEHFYARMERPWLTDEQFARLDDGSRRAFMGAILEDVVRDAVRAVAGSGLSRRDDVQLHRAPLVLDDAAWRVLAERIQDLLELAHEQILDPLELAHELEAEALERQRADGETMNARFVLGLFEAGD